MKQAAKQELFQGLMTSDCFKTNPSRQAAGTIQAYILELRATGLPCQVGDKATESQERISRSHTSGASELLHHRRAYLGDVSTKQQYNCGKQAAALVERDHGADQRVHLTP
jgi:hypothetical protein